MHSHALLSIPKAMLLKLTETASEITGESKKKKKKMLSECNKNWNKEINSICNVTEKAKSVN